MISRKYPGQKIPCLRYYVQDIAMSVSIEDIPKAMLPKSIDGSVSTKYEGIVSWIILTPQYSILPKHRTPLCQITEKIDAKLPKIGIID